MTIPGHTVRGRTRRGLLVGLVAAATAAALPGTATAGTAPVAPVALAARSAAGADAARLTLATGQQVTVAGHGAGPASYLVQPAGPGDDGVVSWQLGTGGDHYVVPVDALPFLGKGLDPSLFDVTALARDAAAAGTRAGARTPVTLAFTAGTAPTAPPGVTLTSVSGSTARGYLEPGSTAAFARALRQHIAADVAAGRRPGSTPLFGGLVSLAAAGSPGAGPAPGAAPAAVTPHYPLHILQLTTTDALGAPADGDVFVVDNDSVAREAAHVPVVGGLGRVAVPAGDYSVAAVFPTWNDEGGLTDLRLVTRLDVTVPDAAGTTAVALDARDATAAVTLHTPRPSVREVTAMEVERVDATGGSAADLGVESWSDASFEVAPAAAATVGRAQYRTRFDTVATDPADAYRYDLAFSADHIAADQAYTADPRLTATVHHRVFADPAADPGASLLAGPFDPGWLNGTEEVSGYTFLTLPTVLTEYVQTYPGSTWSETLGGSTAMVHGEPRDFAGGATYHVDWLHGPLAPTPGVHHTDDYDGCLMCTAGQTALLGYETAGDSTPDHLGTSFRSATLDAYVDGQLVARNDYPGAVLTGVPAGAATYRLVVTTDSGGDPGVSQSTRTVTDLTVHSPAAPDPGSALPPSVYCEGDGSGTPCQILPALDLTYDLATDPTNTSGSPVQAMAVTVGHLSYDGRGSTAPVTSLTVRVSFDGGATWRHAAVTGAHGHYAALWPNPAPAAGVSPTLQVTAKDALGGTLTQTVTDAYTLAAAPARGH